MKQIVTFSPEEATQLLASAIMQAYGIPVQKVEFIIEQSYDYADRPTGIYRLTEIKAWREERGTKTKTD